MTDIATAAPPGWYDDPAEPAQQRWWSGIGWTDHTQALETAVEPAQEPAPEPEPAPAPEPPVAGGAVALGTPLPIGMTTEEQLAWHREPEPVKQNSGSPLGSMGGFDSLAPARGFGGTATLTRNAYRPGEVPAPVPENEFAKSAVLWIVLSIVFDFFFIPSIRSIIIGRRGLARAREIEAMGYSPLSGRGPSQAALVVGIIVLVLHLVGAIAGGVLAATAHAPYDRAGIQSFIAQSAQQQSGMAATVVCPPSEPFTSGSTFECTIALQGGGSAFAEVTVVDSRGGYRVNFSAQSTGASS